MKVIFNRRTPTDDPRYRGLDKLLAAADVVSLHCPLTPETTRLFEAARLSKMKRGVIFINMSRGKVVDEAALVAALESGHVAAAGLDVFENEPAVHPSLLKMEQVTLTPHLGGGTRESRREARELAAENVARVLRGERPLTPVNEVG
jgi:glyoxylate reductase